MSKHGEEVGTMQFRVQGEQIKKMMKEEREREEEKMSIKKKDKKKYV
jgi:hypothetical protein